MPVTDPNPSPPSNAPGPQRLPTRRLPMDAAGTSAEALVRRVAGGFALLAGLWLWMVAEHTVQYAFAVAALLFGLLWLVRNRPAATATQATDYLELSPAGLTVVELEQTEQLPWEQTTGVALDEDRLQVLVLRGPDEPFRVEPGYGALPLRELAEIIYEYRREWNSCIGPTDG